MAFSDDELEEFYRTVEQRTAWRRERPVRRSRPRAVRVCPTPYKDCYRTPMEATEAIERLLAKTGVLFDELTDLAERLQQRGQLHDFAVLPQIGHMINMEAPNDFNEAVARLDAATEKG